MPFPLHKTPVGLLELFRLRTLGAAPNLFGEQVTPVVDVTDMYGLDLLANVFENGPAGAIGVGLAAAQSANARRYQGFNAQITIGAAAGTWLTLAVGYSLIPGGTATMLASVSLTPIVGATYRVAAGAAMRGLLLPPGHNLVFLCDGNAAGADHVPGVRYSFAVLDGR